MAKADYLVSVHRGRRNYRRDSGKHFDESDREIHLERFDSPSKHETITPLPSFLPSFGKMNPSLRFVLFSQCTHTYACIHLHTFQSWHLYTWFHFSSGKSHGISSSLIFITTSRGKKRDTLNNIDDEDPRRSFTWLTSCIKVGLIGWNIYTVILNIDEKYENLYLLF